MSYVPECAREFDCARCHEILDVKVKDSLVKALGVTVSYVPNSKYQFLIEFNFGSAFVTSIFTFVVQINRDFDGCFSESDMNQQITWYVDPAKLIQDEKDGMLTLEDLEAYDNAQQLGGN